MEVVETTFAGFPFPAKNYDWEKENHRRKVGSTSLITLLSFHLTFFDESVTNKTAPDPSFFLQKSCFYNSRGPSNFPPDMMDRLIASAKLGLLIFKTECTTRSSQPF